MEPTEPRSLDNGPKGWLLIVLGIAVSIAAVVLFLGPLAKADPIWLVIGAPAGLIVLNAGVNLILGGFDVRDALTKDDLRHAIRQMRGRVLLIFVANAIRSFVDFIKGDDGMVDPMTIITTISAGLNLVEKFRSVALQFLRVPESQPSVIAVGNKDALEICRNGKLTERIGAPDLKLNKWDNVRYTALEKRVKINWEQFNGIYAAMSNAAADEKVRLGTKMEDVRLELCNDFREMIKIYEATLGVSLGDHYSLYSVCGNHCS